MMRKAILVFGVIAALTMAVPVQADPIVDLYNTGVDGGGVPLGNAALDPHYFVSTSPFGAGPAYTVNDVAPVGSPWIPNTATARWISPAADGDVNVPFPDGVYSYTTSFTLPSVFSDVVISGLWATDNRGVDIVVNGTTSTGISTTPPGSSAFSSDQGAPFAFLISGLDSAFVSGVNTLTFITQNFPFVEGAANPTALQVDGIEGSFSPTAPVPEPASVVLCGMGALGMAAFGWRRRKQAV